MTKRSGNNKPSGLIIRSTSFPGPKRPWERECYLLRSLLHPIVVQSNTGRLRPEVQLLTPFYTILAEKVPILEGIENKQRLQTLSIDNAWSNKNFLFFSTFRRQDKEYIFLWNSGDRLYRLVLLSVQNMINVITKHASRVTILRESLL